MKKYLFSIIIIFLLSINSVLAVAVAPKPPEAGFSILINNGAEITHDKKVVILLNGGSDVQYMALSEREDFLNAPLLPYEGVSEFNLLDIEGIKTIYVKLTSKSGAYSNVFSSEIIYQRAFALPPEPRNPETIDGKKLELGSLFKTAESHSVYYYGFDKKRYVFPTELVFFSWYSRGSFSKVKTISQNTLSTISIGGNVLNRAGGRLVKIKTDSRVYAVGFYGELHWISSESVAKAIYGPKWFQNIDDIPITLFGNYSIGIDIYSIDQIPNGVIFTEGEGKTVFISDNGSKRPFISEEVFKENGFNFGNVKHYLQTELLLGDAIQEPIHKYFDTAAQKPI